MLTQIIERSEGNLNVPIYKYNVESDKHFTAKFGVRSVPTLKLVNEGQIQKTHVGILQESQLQDFII
jgi:thioredoxin-like negative regulator of GroEL